MVVCHNLVRMARERRQKFKGTNGWVLSGKVAMACRVEGHARESSCRCSYRDWDFIAASLCDGLGFHLRETIQYYFTYIGDIPCVSGRHERM